MKGWLPVGQPPLVATLPPSKATRCVLKATPALGGRAATLSLFFIIIFFKKKHNNNFEVLCIYIFIVMDIC